MPLKLIEELFVMRALGVKDINIFCRLMDVCKGLNDTIYYTVVNNIYTASNAILRTLIRKAVEEENELNLQQKKPLPHFTVSSNGSQLEKAWFFVFI